MKITVFGVGYVGLIHAAVMAEFGHNVICIDIDKNKIKNLKNGIFSFFEPGLKSLVKKNYKIGRLNFTTDVKIGINHSMIQFITVGTPQNTNGSANLKYIITVARTIAEHMRDYKIIIEKSTVPVGTASKIHNIIKTILQKNNRNIPFYIVSNPEFLKAGTAIINCMKPERIIIGYDNKKILKPIYKLYKPFNNNRIITMDIRSAELTKYAANCILATKISFINEMSNLAEILGADIEKVRQGIGSDSRIGYHFMYPGCGYGGSCFPKDIQSLIYTAKNIGYTPELLKAVENINFQQKYKLSKFIHNYFHKNLKGKIFALWGLAFKPNTNDIREASSCVLMEQLWKSGAIIQAYDPKAMNKIQNIYGKRHDLKIMYTKESVLKNADALIICTEWKNFRSPNFNLIKKTLKQPLIFDGRNLYDPKKLKKYGFIYYAIGRGSSINSII
ncbi:Putative UDP-glucose 6-dehydrogenase [Serratia symbiotica]|nr:Putative UDP-glucose 6-dehydrogenase [Serratia symbiotica]